MNLMTYLTRRLVAVEAAATRSVMRNGTVRQVSPLLVQLDDDTDTAGSPARKYVHVGTVTVGQRVRVEVVDGFDRLVVGRLT